MAPKKAKKWRRGGRAGRRKRIAEQSMGPIIPRRKRYKQLTPLEKSGVLHIGVVVGEIFKHQCGGTYKFEIRCNINRTGCAWMPQYVHPDGPKKYLYIRAPSAPRGQSGTALCGVFPLRGSKAMDSEPVGKLPIPDKVVEAWRKAEANALKKKPKAGAKPRVLQCYNTTGKPATKYTVYKIDKPVWTGTTAEYEALASPFPWEQ